MNKKIPYIIAFASAIAMFLLVFIQVKWMQQSRQLIEEQFDQKVSMALCMAVDEVSKTKDVSEIRKVCKTTCKTDQKCCSTNLTNFISTNGIREIVSKSLGHYKISMPFELKVSDKNDTILASLNNKKNYSCSMNPIIKSDIHRLNVDFPGKKEYVLKKMALMLGSSILIMLLILGVFIYAIYYLLKQKRISEQNIDFFNHMAHEFKTPLTNIGLASKLMSKKMNDPLLEIISSENQQLSTQVNRVLSMASLERGKYELAKKKINVKETIDSLIDQLRIQYSEQDVEINIKGNNDILIKADLFHFTNAIRNLIDNAIKYNQNSPQINIKITDQSHKVKIEIKDNGIGISPANQKLIFKKFYRITEGDTYEKKGFGLGLSYVKKIIELHKGEIRIHSEIQRGTRFEISIPKMATT